VSEPEIADRSHNIGGNFDESNDGAESPPGKKQKLDEDASDLLDLDDFIVRTESVIFRML
jgi:hypothetical protein